VIFNLREMSPFKPAALVFRFPLMHVDRPSRGEILRSYVESLAFAVRGNCEQLVAVSRTDIPALAVSGGMTRGATLTRVLADSLGVPLAVAEVPESASLGCAVLASVGSGLHADLPTAVGAMTRAQTVEPDPDRRAYYDERYGRWRELYDTLRTWTL
jgi:sugar (pentulose or hexulose) kinase